MTQFAFRAASIATSMPANDNFVGNNSNVNITTQPTAAPISDAINNVRFACTGFAGHGAFETALFTLNTAYTFNFRPRAIGRLTAHTHFMPQGGFSLVGRAPTWFFDGPGSVSFNILARMRVRVFAANGTMPLNILTPFINVFHGDALGGAVADSSEGSVDSNVLEHFISRTFETIVVLTDVVQVQARYTVQAMAVDGAEFALDFASIPPAFGQPGDGLNAPFAVINIAR